MPPYRSIHHKINCTALKWYRFRTSKVWRLTLYFTIFVILTLAFFELPSSLTWTSDIKTRGIRLDPPCGLTEAIEVACLLIFTADVSIKFYVFGRKQLLNRKWVMAYLLVVCISLIDWLITLSQSCSDPVRFRRVLRPFFLIQNSSIMKKTVNSIKRTLPEIASILLLLGLHLYFFTMFGMLLFPTNQYNGTSPVWVPDSAEGQEHFSTIESSFISLLVLLTTANNPDVTVQAYSANRFYALYFIVFLVIGLYCLMNMLTAVIYNRFRGYFLTSIESSLFRRKVALLALFRVLRKPTEEDVISVAALRTVIVYSSLSKSRKALMLQNLNAETQFEYTLHDFQNFFTLLHAPLRSKSQRASFHTYTSRCFAFLQCVILHQYFSNFGHLVNIANVICISVELSLQYKGHESSTHALLQVINLILINYYFVELCLKVWAIGVKRYFFRYINIMDSLIIFSLVILELYYISNFGLPLRPLKDMNVIVTGGNILESWNVIRVINMLIMIRLIRVIRQVKSLLLVMDALLDLARNMRAFAGIVIVVYYCFAMLGMELFKGVIKYDSNTNSTGKVWKCGSYEQLEYWPNNFDDFAASLIVLWDLMVVNNWQVFLTIFQKSTGTRWSHIFFIAWFLVSVVIVLNVFTALILENFIMKWEKQQSANDSSEHQAPTSRPSTVQEMFREMCKEPDGEETWQELESHEFFNSI